MVKPILPEEIRSLLEAGTPLLDVRSEGEFAHARVPGSVSMPLFNNEERARVGTTYKQLGQQEAILLGLELVGPKMRWMVEQALAFAPDKKVLLYCWRGGMRSGSVGWLLSQAGFEVFLIKGGYKGWRRHALNLLAKPWKLIVLGGSTGSGKTHVLNALPQFGEQAVDLEALACHRGSAFGAIGMPAQPSVEMFENQLAYALEGLDPERRIWLEDESRMIGRVVINDPFWSTIQAAPTVVLEVDLERRVQNLVDDYAQLPNELLAESINRISRKLGPQHAKKALDELAEGKYADVARALLGYYDKGYGYGLGQKVSSLIIPMEVSEGEKVEETAQRLLSLKWKV